MTSVHSSNNEEPFNRNDERWASMLNETLSKEGIEEFLSKLAEIAHDKEAATKLAQESLFSEQAFEQNFSQKDNPNLKTLITILAALGLKLRISPVKKIHPLLTPDEVDKWGMLIGGLFHLTYTNVICLEDLIEISKEHPLLEKKYQWVFHYFYRIFFDRLYLNICKLLDEREDVLSLPTFFARCKKKNEWKKIKKEESFAAIQTPIQNWRHKILAHTDLKLATSPDLAYQFYEENKQDLPKINIFLTKMKDTLEKLLDEMGHSITHIRLGDGPESREFRALLLELAGNM